MPARKQLRIALRTIAIRFSIETATLTQWRQLLTKRGIIGRGTLEGMNAAQQVQHLRHVVRVNERQTLTFPQLADALGVLFAIRMSAGFPEHREAWRQFGAVCLLPFLTEAHMERLESALEGDHERMEQDLAVVEALLATDPGGESRMALLALRSVLQAWPDPEACANSAQHWAGMRQVAAQPDTDWRHAYQRGVHAEGERQRTRFLILCDDLAHQQPTPIRSTLKP